MAGRRQLLYTGQIARSAKFHLHNFITSEGRKLIRKKRDEDLSFLDAFGRELKTDDDPMSSPVFSP
jgi:hypothetical protein